MDLAYHVAIARQQQLLAEARTDRDATPTGRRAGLTALARLRSLTPSRRQAPAGPAACAAC